MEIVLIGSALIISVLLVIILKRQWMIPAARDDQSIFLLQQQIEALRSDVRGSLQQITDNVNHQLTSVTQQIQNQTTNVGSRLDSATRVIGDVQKNLGELGQATKEIKELGQNVSRLDELLRAPKLRGGLGEYLLEDLLKQVLPSGHFEMQHRFRNGQTVDAVIKTSEHLVSVDSKFPLENFRRMLMEIGDTEKKALQKIFIGDVKRHIDAIASKYIVTDEGTFPFALMYIPAENIYYEIIIRDEGMAEGSGAYDYALERKVIPVSPNSFYAYLQVIALGLRGMSIERSAKEIFGNLTRLVGDLGKVREVFDTLGMHLDNARKKYEDADKKLLNFESRLENIADHSLNQDSATELLPP